MAAPPKKDDDDPNAPVSYFKKVRPIFQAQCQGCHQPAKAQGGYVMTDFAKLLAGGEECAQDGTRAIVFAGGAGVFCAGNDIADFLQAGAKGLSGSPALQFIRKIATCTVPMIAAVDGLAIGIGTTMTLHCDLVYASPRAVFKMPFVDLGLVPEAGASLLVPARFGMGKATEMLMLGDAFDAGEAQRIGLVNAMIAPDQLLAHALAQAERLAAKPGEALAATRRLMRGDIAALSARIETEIEAFSKGMQSAEARQIFAAFLAKSKG